MIFAWGIQSKGIGNLELSKQDYLTLEEAAPAGRRFECADKLRTEG